jgi:predicted transcriptional regulator|tara:strand:+ start:1375 stop:1569 length:195 start_codon:yes stop_codon:yes gene_type:complete
MTVREEIILQLKMGNGTCRQLWDRTDLKLSTIRTVISELRVQGIVVNKEKVGRENVWSLVEDAM